jgi:hypothetical protein
VSTAPVLSALLTLLLLTSEASTSSPSDDIDVATVLKAIGVPQCFEQCTVKFVEDLRHVLSMTNTLDNIKEVCTEYVKVKSCVANASCHHEEVFYTVLSGVESLCGPHKSKFFEKHRACIQMAIDTNANECNAQCNFTQSLAEFSQSPRIRQLANQGGSLLRVLGELGGICVSSDCYLPCFRDRMNAACPRSGGMILDSMLRPFYTLADLVEESGPMVHNFVDNKVPKSCLFLTKTASLNEVRKPGSGNAGNDNSD